MNITRREMLKLGACGSALWIAGNAVSSRALAAPRKIPIALELYSVREEAQKDLPRVLAAVAEMGYAGVELAHSDYGVDGAQWRKLLDQNGLKVCGMHTTVPKVQGDNLQKMIDFQQAIGNRTLILAALPKQNMSSVKGLLDSANLLNDLADKLKPHGMRVGYHCHGGDFQPTEGQIPWEVLGSNTRPEVIMQIDVGNCLGGGGDYLAMLKKFASRAATVHLKEHGAPAGGVIGEGQIQWNEVFQVCESGDVTEWYIVEEESRKGPESLDAVRRCLQNLRKMGK
jgi:sugar phosphate isomerase/epimerase